jgi:hypothetical protein
MQLLEPPPKMVVGLTSSSRRPGGISVPAYPDDPRWQLAQRIAASGSLGRSRLLADFLLYVVDRHICNRTDEITEQQIGVLVFGRAEGYDSNDDNIVRSYARNLRKRIDEYFATEGREETLRFEIPRGGYAPIFFSLAAEISASSDSPFISNSESAETIGKEERLQSTAQIALSGAGDGFLPHSIDPPAVRWFQKIGSDLIQPKFLLVLGIGILLGLAASFFRSAKTLIVSPEENASHLLWRQLFSSDRDTFVVPADDGLVIMQRLTERPVALSTYVNGTYRTKVKTDGGPADAEILKLGGRRYTSVVDLDFVARLAQLKEVVPERMMIRYARDLRMDDLRTGNAILIGSKEADPWIELFEPELNFRFRYQAGIDKQSQIVNVHPRAGEQLGYLNPGDGYTYGVISYLPNLNNAGHVLIVGGLNSAGTEAATAFLMNPSLMRPTLEHAKSADGTLQRFELLVGAGNVATNASTPHVILERIGSPQAR